MTKSNKLTIAAGGLLKRFAATEHEAERIASEQNGDRMVRAVLNEAGLHALISDGKTTLEIKHGEVAIAVNNGEE